MVFFSPSVALSLEPFDRLCKAARIIARLPTRSLQSVSLDLIIITTTLLIIIIMHAHTNSSMLLFRHACNSRMFLFLRGIEEEAGRLAKQSSYCEYVGSRRGDGVSHTHAEWS
jgi:hypothetical protein